MLRIVRHGWGVLLDDCIKKERLGEKKNESCEERTHRTPADMFTAQLLLLLLAFCSVRSAVPMRRDKTATSGSMVCAIYILTLCSQLLLSITYFFYIASGTDVCKQIYLCHRSVHISVTGCTIMTNQW